MALILIFAGSLTGMLIGGYQMMLLNATVWTAFSTYVGFSLGFPILVGLFALTVAALRGRSEEQDEFGLYNV